VLEQKIFGINALPTGKPPFSWDNPRVSHARGPMDPGILSIPGFLGPTRYVPCQWSLWILEYCISWNNPHLSVIGYRESILVDIAK